MGRDRPAGRPLLLRSDRKGERPAGHLKGSRGVLQVDGYVSAVSNHWTDSMV